MGKFVARNNIILRDISAKGRTVECRIQTSEGLSKYFTTDTFFIEYDEDMSNVPQSILACPFVASLLAFAWVTDSVIWVDEIDRRFYDSLFALRQEYQDIYRTHQLLGRVVPSKFIRNLLKDECIDSKAILLFSGGADCHASLIRNLDKRPTLCNIQGWFKSINSTDAVADADKRDIEKFAHDFNLPFKYVRSNFAKVINSEIFDRQYKKHLGDTLWHGFLHSMAFISIAIPMAYKWGIDEIIIASSLTTGLNFLCASNSTTDSAFAYANNGGVLHDGFELHRQNKIKVITDFQRQLGKPYFMRVCSFNDSNCCHCEKCFRTVLGIVAENSDPEDFGFHHNGSLKQHWNDELDKHIALMSFASERCLHWPHIIRRMKENYKEMSADKQEFVDWFLDYDFEGKRRKALRYYYRTNFFSILKRKFHL